MRTVLEPIYGSQDKFDLQLVKPRLLLDGSREIEALETGWGVYRGEWYLCRSTRLRVADWTSPKPIRGYSITLKETLTEEELAQTRRVTEEFLRVRNYFQLYDVEADLDRASWLLVSNDAIRAFTKFQKYDGAVESNVTAWDYSEPRKSIGKKIVEHEVQVARELGYEHLYVGPGYNESSSYKASLPGFEWWDGQTWNRDADKYIQLCQRDDTIRTLADLSNLYAV